MKDWLRWFNTCVNRHVLLLIDNSLAYELAVQNLDVTTRTAYGLRLGSQAAQRIISGDHEARDT